MTQCLTTLNKILFTKGIFGYKIVFIFVKGSEPVPYWGSYNAPSDLLLNWGGDTPSLFTLNAFSILCPVQFFKCDHLATLAAYFYCTMMILLHSILCINVKVLVVNPVVFQNDF